MREKSVLITGASSFTGCYIAEAFASSGYHVFATLTRHLANYSSEIEIKRLRVAGVYQWLEETPVDSERLLDLASEREFDLFVNHGWPKVGYHQGVTDLDDFFTQTTQGWDTVLQLLKKKNPKIKVLHTGSVYEAGEGGSPKNPPLTDYGKLKTKAWEKIHATCNQLEISLGKVVLPNPIGPLEDGNKLLSSFWQAWQEKQCPQLKTANWERDNITTEKVSQSYLRCAGELDKSSYRVIRPSQFILSNLEMVQLLAEIGQKKGLACPFTHTNGDSSAHWQSRINSTASEKKSLLAAYLKKWFTN